MEVTRREFLKNSMIGTFGLAGVGELSPLFRMIQRSRNISTPTGTLSMQSFPTTCKQCNARCGILGFLESNKLVAIYGNPDHPNSNGKICARGMAGINLSYDPERLLFPLRRKGRRGEGKWERISWDEAYEEIAGSLKEIKGSNDWLFLDSCGGELLTPRFLKALGFPRIFINSPAEDLNGKKARKLTLGEDTVIPDLAHSKYILNFGSNPYNNNDFYIPLMKRLVDGKINNRAKLVTLDVRLSNTAAQSDEWLPVFPGTDGIVALAIANVIMRQGLFDRDFMERWTNYPVDELETYLSSFSPERAGKVSGLKKEEIERVALEFARNKPAVAISGGGIWDHENGTQNERCILLLNALAGSIDRKGGCMLPRRLQWDEPSPRPPENKLWENPGTIIETSSRLRKEKSKIGLYLSYLANPVYSSPQCKSTMGILKDESFISRIIVVDTHMSETAAWADMVLPAATYLESWGIESTPSFDHTPFLAISQPIINPEGESESLRSTRTARLTEPVIKPFGEAVAWEDILIRVANRMGGKMRAYFNFGSFKDYIKETLTQFKGLKSLGGINYLKERGVWVSPEGKTDYESYRKNGFKTPSGKFEVYSSPLKSMDFSPLPSYDPLSLPKEGKFVLITFSSHVHTFRTSNSKWISEVAHENPVWINKEAARSMGIGEGDKIRIESKTGGIVGKAHLTSGIHPRAVAVSRGFGHWGYGHVSRGKKFNSPDPDTHEIWWESNGINPNPIIPINRDPIGKGQAWKDTKVKITKA